MKIVGNRHAINAGGRGHPDSDAIPQFKLNYRYEELVSHFYQRLVLNRRETPTAAV
jgi:hypothetical protein